MANLIDEYIDYVTAASDAPEIFHRICGYFVISTILGRYCSVPVPYQINGLKPNIWVLLIGPSRIVRKTTAMRFARFVIEQVDQDLFLPEEYSPEALYETISDMTTGDAGCWVRDEFGSFFKSLSKKYMYGIRGFLSSLYSGVGGRRQLRGQSFRIQDGIYITVIGTMPTPPHEYFTPDDFMSIVEGKNGVVIAGTGLGHVNEKLIPCIEELTSRGIPVVMTTQCLWGRVNLNVYSTGRKLKKAGVISGEDMLPETALVKLMWALGHDDAIAIMKKNIAGEMTERSVYNAYQKNYIP